MNANPVRIGSRGSALALAQAGLVREALEAAGAAATIVVIETAGDRRAPDTAWGEGAFVSAIEQALLDRRIDVAVHSAKDIPTDEDPRLRIAAYLPRADPRDALVLRSGPEPVEGPGADLRPAVGGLEALRPGTRVGTDSPRRTAFLRRIRPDLEVHPLHGNVDTRLRRLDAGETDALVLACAGLDRLGLSDRIAARLDASVIPPAPGQGAIALQLRADDAALLAAAAAIDDPSTRLAVELERAFLHATGGGCRAPIGALATVGDDDVEILAGVAEPGGSRCAFGTRRGRRADAEALTHELVAELAGSRLAGTGTLGAPRPRVLVTRGAHQATALVRALRDAGLEPVVVPAIEIELADAALIARALEDAPSGWCVVTSPNGARAVAAALGLHDVAGGTRRWAAVGDATRRALEAEGLPVAFVPSRPTGAALGDELPIEVGEQVLAIRGDLADHRLIERLRGRGARVVDMVGYQTHEAPETSRALLRAAAAGGDVAALTFASGSAARGLRRLAELDGLDLTDIPAVCAGDSAAAVAASLGFRVAAVAEAPEPAALARATAEALAASPLEIA